MASLPQSVVNFLKREEEAKIQKQQEKESKQQEKQRKQAENQIKAKEQQEIQNFLRHRRADFIRIQKERRNFLKVKPGFSNNGKRALLLNIERHMGIPEPSEARNTFYKNESPEAVALQGEILSTLKREWEAKKAEEKAIEEAGKEAERQGFIERNEEEKRKKEEELARLRLSLRPRVEEDIAKMIKSGHLPSSIPLTGNKVYDEIFAELIQPHIERFQKEKSRKGLQEAYEYISRRQKDGIKHLGQWTGSEITPTEEEILERLKIAINGGSGFESDISKKIFNEYLKASNHSGGRRKTRRGRKHRRRSTRRKQ
jgi:hypothetical protein